MLLGQPGARGVKNVLTDLCKKADNTWARQWANTEE